jgi:hypothetical protein
LALILVLVIPVLAEQATITYYRPIYMHKIGEATAESGYEFHVFNVTVTTPKDEGFGFGDLYLAEYCNHTLYYQNAATNSLSELPLELGGWVFINPNSSISSLCIFEVPISLRGDGSLIYTGNPGQRITIQDLIEPPAVRAKDINELCDSNKTCFWLTWDGACPAASGGGS